MLRRAGQTLSDNKPDDKLGKEQKYPLASVASIKARDAIVLANARGSKHAKHSSVTAAMVITSAAPATVTVAASLCPTPTILHSKACTNTSPSPNPSGPYIFSKPIQDLKPKMDAKPTDKSRDKAPEPQSPQTANQNRAASDHATPTCARLPTSDWVYKDRFSQLHVVPGISDTPPVNIKVLVANGKRNMLPERPTDFAAVDRRPSKKTNEICLLYQRGRCKYEERCHRSHVPPDSQSSHFPAAGHNGWPKFIGNNAPHEVSPFPSVTVSTDLSGSQTWSTSDSRNRLRPICRAHLRGYCYKGSQCRYLHENASTSALAHDKSISATSAAETSSLSIPKSSELPLPIHGEPEVGQDDRDRRIKVSTNGGKVFENNEMNKRPMPPNCSSTRDGKAVAPDVVPVVAPGHNVEVPHVIQHPLSRPPPSQSSSASRVTDSNQTKTTATDAQKKVVPQRPSEEVGDLPSNSLIASKSYVDVPSWHVRKCRDFVAGNCARARCKFAHIVEDDQRREHRKDPQEPLRNQPNGQPLGQDQRGDQENRPPVGRDRQRRPVNEQTKPTDRLLDMLNVSAAKGPEVSRTHLDNTANSSNGNSSKHCGDQPSLPRVYPQNVPLVPPGLGLERLLVNGSLSPPRKEPPETITLKIFDSAKVTYGPGFDVHQVVTSFDTHHIILGNIPPNVAPANITAALSSFGEITGIVMLEPAKKSARANVRVTFAKPDDAARAVASLDGSTLFKRTISVHLASRKSTSLGKGVFYDCDVLFEMPLPHKTGFAGFETEAMANAAVAKANNTEFRGYWITAEVYEGLPRISPWNVRFYNMPPDTQAKDLGRYGKNDDVMFERPNLKLKPQSLINSLQQVVRRYGEVTMSAIPPPYKRQVIRVWARFNSPAVASQTAAALNGRLQRFLGDNKLYAHHVKTLQYSLPPDVYDTLATDIKLLRAFAYDNSRSSISTLDRRVSCGPATPVLVKLVSRRMDALTSLKAAFDRLLKGEKVVQNGEIVWDDFFGRRAGISFLEDLEKKFSGVKINRDSRRRTLALFGAPEKRAAVRSAILGLVSQQQEQKIRAFPVDGRFIGVFMSADLVKLQQELGHENVWFDLTNHMLKVRGDKDAHKVAQLAVVHARSQRIAPRRRGEVECPVCFGEVTHPVTLKCGHSWCKACLTRYLVVSADTKVFPLTCLGNEATCSHAIPLATAQELLTTNEFESIIHASFLSYVQSRPSEFHYCPTPDCNQIYRTATPEKVIHCPSCLIRICPACHTEYHDGAECVDKEAEDDKLFEEWKNAHDVKDCPSCKVPIERIAGCNHMACISCKTHICWACLATFTRSDEVYEHMRATHGGIGLGLD